MIGEVDMQTQIVNTRRARKQRGSVVKSASCIFLSAVLMLATFATLLPTAQTKANNNEHGEYWYFNYTGQIQSVKLPNCEFKLEVWGAQGGGAAGGRSGYSVGSIEFDDYTTVYIAVGGMGQTGAFFASGGFNGGGNMVNANSGSVSTGDGGSIGGSGGGATHISLASGLLTENSVRDEILLVAGGGGGAGGNWHTWPTVASGGAGGGANGLSGALAYNNPSRQPGGGGTQITGGTGGGIAGRGGNSRDTANTISDGAGGGGWFGGGGATNGGPGGGGGSGFVSPTLDDAQTIPGNVLIPNPLGGTMIGNSGNGFVRITAIECPDLTQIISIRAEISPGEVMQNGVAPTITVWGTAKNGEERILTPDEFTFTPEITTTILGEHIITIIHGDLTTTVAYAVIPFTGPDLPITHPEVPNSGINTDSSNTIIAITIIAVLTTLSALLVGFQKKIIKT